MRPVSRVIAAALLVPVLGQAAAVFPVVRELVPAPPAASAATTTSLRVATFNVRTARATDDARPWLKRVTDVAADIMSAHPGIVLLQELGPGRADGNPGHLDGHQRQTDSLLTALAKAGGKRYRLVRTTAYVKPGTAHGTQGARILYDSKLFTLLSHCPQTTGTSGWNASCSFDLPIAGGDTAADRRSAAYAEFADKSTGRRFWVVTAHLDNRHGSTKTAEAKWNRLRVKQVAAIESKITKLNRGRLPVIFGGDLNSWQRDDFGYAPHDKLVGYGFHDAVAATTRTHYAYPTVNHFDRVLKPTKLASGGSRLDVIMVKRVKKFTKWVNKFNNPDSTRPSDHNMVVSNLQI
jgi:predicted extracellular nuclease